MKRRDIIAIILGLCVIATLLIAAIENVSYNEENIYKYNIKSSNIDNTNLSPDELFKYSKNIADYLKSNNDQTILYDLSMNEKEIKHMEDVNSIYRMMNYIKIALGAVILFIILFFAFKKENVFKSKSLFITLFGGYVIPIFALILSKINFNDAFITFHKIFFRNNLWQMDPSTDKIINIMPQDFFVWELKLILIYFSISLFVIHLCSFYYIYISDKRKKADKK